MKLYYFETPNGRRACAVAKHLGLPVEYVRINLGRGEQKAPSYLAINPNGKIPALADGPLKLWEADAIMCHLARKTGSDMWPTDERQVEVLRWLSWNSDHFSRHAGTLFFENLIKVRFSMGETDQAAVVEAEGFVREFGQILDNQLRGRNFLVGDGLTIADFSVASLLPYARDAKLPLDGFAEIARWHEGLMKLPAWREPFPAIPDERAVA